MSDHILLLSFPLFSILNITMQINTLIIENLNVFCYLIYTVATLFEDFFSHVPSQMLIGHRKEPEITKSLYTQARQKYIKNTLVAIHGN